MQLTELPRKLYDVCDKAEKGKKVIAIHLFGIKYAEQIREYGSLNNLVKDASIHTSYKTEIRKGMNLSPYVSMK